MMYRLLLLCLLPFLPLSISTLLVNFIGDDPTDTLGRCRLEGQNIGDDVVCPGNSSVFIKPSVDLQNKTCLQYHRSAHFRCAEVKMNGEYRPNKNYYIGFSFQLSNIRDKLVLFQW